MKVSGLKRSMGILLIVLSSIVAIALLAAAYGGHVDPRNHSYFSILVLGFPIAVLGSVLWLALCAACREWKAVVIIAASLVLSLPAIHMVMPLSWGGEPDDENRSFKVMTWNVVGFEPVSDTTPCATVKHILDVDADIVLLQETSLDTQDYLKHYMVKPLRDELTKRYPYRTKGCHDVAIMSKYPFKLVEDTTMRNRRNFFGAGTYHTFGKAYDLNVKGRDLRIISVHMQSIGLNDDDKRLYKDIAKFDEKVHTPSQLKQVKTSLTDKLASSAVRRAEEAVIVRNLIDSSPENVILCGDFNDVPRSYAYFTMRGDDMNDAHVDCGTMPINTYNRDGMYFKIDHVLYRGGMKAVNTRRDKAGASDHYPIITTFQWKE